MEHERPPRRRGAGVLGDEVAPVLLVGESLERLGGLDFRAVVDRADVAGVERDGAPVGVDVEPLPDVVNSSDVAGLGEQVAVDLLVDTDEFVGVEPQVQVGVDADSLVPALDVVVYLAGRRLPDERGVELRLELLFDPLAGTDRRRVEERALGPDHERRVLVARRPTIVRRAVVVGRTVVHRTVVARPIVVIVTETACDCRDCPGSQCRDESPSSHYSVIYTSSIKEP
jgi:hypothetical protein